MKAGANNPFLPIEAVHSGPYVTKFPADENEQTIYETAQRALKVAAVHEGYQFTGYPARLTESTKNVYIKDIDLPSEKKPLKNKINKNRANRHAAGQPYSRQRGLFAKKNFKKDEAIVPYEGLILNLNDFEARYPIYNKGKIVHLSNTDFIPDPKNRSKDVIIIENEKTIKLDIHGLTGTIVKFDEVGHDFIIRLDGYREAHHTLSLDAKYFIDAEVKTWQANRGSGIEAGKTYVAGMGAFANSVDKIFQEQFQKKQTPNATYWISAIDKKAVLVATKPIKKDEEILIDSYLKGNKFKSETELWKSLKIKPKIAKEVKKTRSRHFHIISGNNEVVGRLRPLRTAIARHR